jgi:pimeloyl-ACP methyl ester carboxylesterase
MAAMNDATTTGAAPNGVGAAATTVDMGQTSVVELTAGPIAYTDTGGDGPVLVLIHGLVMDGRLWQDVVADLRSDFRCIAPTLPFGAHRRPMNADADLSLRGIGQIVADFLDALDLHEVTLVFNDWSGAQVMVADDRVDRVGRLALVSCEAFENIPPGIPGRLAFLSAKLPGGLASMRHMLAIRPLRRLPITFGHMTKRGIPDALMDEWLEPLANREIRRDLAKYATQGRRARAEMMSATPALASFDRPVLNARAAVDRVMPIAHARRVAGAFPNASVVEIPDSYTLVPLDQPHVLAHELRRFGASEPRPGSPSPATAR